MTKIEYEGTAMDDEDFIDILNTTKPSAKFNFKKVFSDKSVNIIKKHDKNDSSNSNFNSSNIPQGLEKKPLLKQKDSVESTAYSRSKFSPEKIEVNKCFEKTEKTPRSSLDSHCSSETVNSKYFHNDSKNSSLKLNNVSPLRRLIKTKETTCKSQNSSTSKSKKFVFKKRSVNSNIEDLIQFNDTPTESSQNTELNSNCNNESCTSKENESQVQVNSNIEDLIQFNDTPTESSQNAELNSNCNNESCTSKENESQVQTIEQNNVRLSVNLLNTNLQNKECEIEVTETRTFSKEAEPFSISQSLNITEADYMDDEEFEKRFGSFADSVDENILEDPQEVSVAPQDEATKELLNEISSINWDDNCFDEEPKETGFKDRNDDSKEFQGEYVHSHIMLEVLHEKFGMRSFRPHQREIINASLTQHDCFVLMPTGGGKSLCYQLPAVLMPGITVVISPLMALISDQVDKLNALDIPAAHLCSDQSKAQCDQIYKQLSLREPTVKLLYLTPEKISAARIIIEILTSLYQRGKLARFVIDEVHCLSQWGHDFRPDYKNLSKLRKNYPEVPIICLTATATKQVENDVINILNLHNVKRFIRSFNRPNIKYQIIQKKGKVLEEIGGLIKEKFPKQSGIVYCLFRKHCDKIAEDFNRMGIKSKPYHAGMSSAVRTVIQREWMQDRFHVIVATIAFGMGIDKPDVRFVIHNSIPKSVEAFYQESGRAGRDGEVSYSYLYYSYTDVGHIQKLITRDKTTKGTRDAHMENLRQMVAFAEDLVDCRRHQLLIHLGEHFDRKLCIANRQTTCDNCENIDKNSMLEISKEARMLCAIVKDIACKEKVTMNQVVGIYKGSKAKKLLDRNHDRHRFYGVGSNVNNSEVTRILKHLILKHILTDYCVFTGEFPLVYIKPGPKFYQFFNSNQKLSISVSSQTCSERRTTSADEDRIEDPDSSGTSSVAEKRNSAPSSSSGAPRNIKKPTPKLQASRKLQLAQLKVKCHEDLLEECRRLAMERNLTLSSIMNLSAIKNMSDVLPSTKEEMLKIQHVTLANYSKYGEFFLKITTAYRKKHDALLPLTQLSKKNEISIDSFTSEEESDMHFQAPPSNKSQNSWKRKKSWGGRKGGNKRRKNGDKKQKRATTSVWRGKRGKSGSKLGLMPVHIK